MLKIPYTDILQKISEKTGLSDAAIEQKISEKLRVLSGLISKEGAAHIIANELGVPLFEKVSGRLQVKNILAGMRSVETVGRVVQVYEVRDFQTEQRTGTVGSFILGDETGTIRIVCWGDLAQTLKQFKQGDIIKLRGGYVRENQGRKEVHLNDKSVLIVNPKDEQVPELVPRAVMPIVRKQIKALSEADQSVELLGTIVQVTDPRFYEVCPSCNRRVLGNPGAYTCSQHGAVTPDYSYVSNVILDDGTDTIRAVFFRDQVESLFKKSKQEMLASRDQPELLATQKNELLGKIVKIAGRVNKNVMFERLEVITRTIDLEPNPEEELAKMEKT